MPVRSQFTAVPRPSHRWRRHPSTGGESTNHSCLPPPPLQGSFLSPFNSTCCRSPPSPQSATGQLKGRNKSGDVDRPGKRSLSNSKRCPGEYYTSHAPPSQCSAGYDDRHLRRSSNNGLAVSGTPSHTSQRSLSLLKPQLEQLPLPTSPPPPQPPRVTRSLARSSHSIHVAHWGGVV